MIDIDKNLEIFYEREENKEDTYIGAISKHECVVDGWFVIELLEEVKELRAWKKLVSDIVQQQDGSHLREMLKEMIE